MRRRMFPAQFRRMIRQWRYTRVKSRKRTVCRPLLLASHRSRARQPECTSQPLVRLLLLRPAQCRGRPRPPHPPRRKPCRLRSPRFCAIQTPLSRPWVDGWPNRFLPRKCRGRSFHASTMMRCMMSAVGAFSRSRETSISRSLTPPSGRVTASRRRIGVHTSLVLAENCLTRRPKTASRLTNAPKALSPPMLPS